MTNKILYKLEIIITKYMPITIAVLYLVASCISYYEYDWSLLPMLCGMSLFPLAKLYIDSLTFKLCFHHRVFIYYILVHNIISNIDYFTYGEIFKERDLFLTYIILFSITLFVYIILKRRYDFSRKHSS